MSKLGVTLVVTSARSVESAAAAAADVPARVDKVGNCCVGPAHRVTICEHADTSSKDFTH